jgi:aminoglycoside phosphotransferase (APT) family kinase protein
MIEHVTATTPLTFELIAGGRSNLTYQVTDAGQSRFALRHPPINHVIATAHDMVRECTVIPALRPLGIPVSTPFAKAYAAHSSLDVSEVAYYQAFGYWKLACILQGVFARYSARATAGDQGSVAEFPTHIAMLAETAKRTLES